MSVTGLKQDFKTFPGVFEKNYFFFSFPHWWWARSLEIVCKLMILKCSEENLEPKIIYQIWDCSLFFHLKCVLHYQAVYDILVLFIAYGRSTLEIQNNLLSFRFFFFFLLHLGACQILVSPPETESRLWQLKRRGLTPGLPGRPQIPFFRFKK